MAKSGETGAGAAWYVFVYAEEKNFFLEKGVFRVVFL